MIRWIIIILAALAIGAAGYYYYMYPSVETLQMGAEPETVSIPEGQTADLEAELETVSVEGLDAELGDIERELSQ